MIIVTFTYLLVGAAIFDALEGPNNEKVKEGLVELRENLKQKYKITENDYKIIEVLIEERKPHKTGAEFLLDVDTSLLVLGLRLVSCYQS